MPERLPDSVQTLYAELLDQLIVAQAETTWTPASGSFVRKEVKGHIYWYFQRREGERRRQHYLGPESPPLLAWMERVRQARTAGEADAAQRARLCRMLAAGGAWRESAPVLRVLELLADSGVFRLGGVLVGTRAFAAYGNVLGARFEHRALATQDVDVAQDPTITVALAPLEPGDVERALVEADLGFVPVPQLDPRQPSTSFKIRGRELRVDFLTPLRGRDSGRPVRLPGLKVAAQPLRFLDYLLEETLQAAVVGGSGILVNLPDPARFSLHKLWTASRRPASEHTRARKDLHQATELLTLLLEDRPHDLPPAWQALTQTPAAHRRVLSSLERLDGELRGRLEGVISGGP